MTGGTHDLAGRTALVTGATNGVGAELAKALARRGAAVLAGCRSPERFERLCASVLKADGETGGEAGGVPESASDGAEAAARLRPAPADLESGAAVDALAERLIDDGEPLDLLFLNAGIHDVPHTLTADGHEKTIAANFLGHFRLLHRLAVGGALSAEARIVVTQSEAVHSNPLACADLEILAEPRTTALRRAVWRAIASPNTKVLLALTAIEYGRRVHGTALGGTRMVAGSPGALRTGNVDQPGLAMKLLKLFAPLILNPASSGAELLLWVATAPESGARSGIVWGRDRRPVKLSRRASDPEMARRVWESAERALALPPFRAPGAIH